MATKKYNGIPYHLWNLYTPMDIFLPRLGVGSTVLTRGEGHYLYNGKGMRYLNARSCAWNFSIGFGREEIIEAATKQMRELPYSSCFGEAHPRAIELAAKLIEITSGNYAHVYLDSNGSEVVDTSLKLARQYHRQSPLEKDHGRFKIISLRGSYHGCSYGATSLVGSERHEAKFGPLLPGIVHIDPPYCYRCSYQKDSYPECGLECAHTLEKTVLAEGPESVAAFIFEPIMGEMGVIIPPEEYYRVVGQICRQYGVLLIVDEITTGFGRTGELFVSQKWDYQPDILLVGKAISGGYFPMAAALTTEAIFERFFGYDNHFMHGTTNSGHPVGAAVSLVAIDIIIREKLADNSAKVGAYLKTKLTNLINDHPLIGDVRGRGLMIGIDLTRDHKTKEWLSQKEIRNIMFSSIAHGLLAAFPDCGVSIFPPLIIDEAVADEIVALLDKILRNDKLANLDKNIHLLQTFIRSKL